TGRAQPAGSRRRSHRPHRRPADVGGADAQPARGRRGVGEQDPHPGREVPRFLRTHAAQIVNNLDWTSQFSAIDFLRDVGKHFPVNRMLAKESVAARLKNESGLSFTEFSYQVLQGNDYLELYRRYGCTLQTGGSDQWGNLTPGVDLIRRVEDR